MLELGAGRHAAIRDLDAIVARLHELAPEDWERDTPDEGWTVRHLAAHLTTSIPFITDVLGQIVAVRLGHLPTMETGIEVTPESDHHDITASVTQHRNAFVHTISAMTEDDLGAIAPGGSVFPRSGQLYLAMSTFECGIHRYDLEASQNEPGAGLSDEAILGIDAVMCENMALFASGSGKHPEAPVSFVFPGSLVKRRLTWDGESWSTAEVDGVPEIRFHGDDSALALFICGRITIDNHRLRVEGDRDVAAAFKTYVPGP